MTLKKRGPTGKQSPQLLKGTNSKENFMQFLNEVYIPF